MDLWSLELAPKKKTLTVMDATVLSHESLWGSMESTCADYPSVRFPI